MVPHGRPGRYDEKGNIYFVDRAKNSIRRKGENISSFEVEQILLKMDEIKDVAVFPVVTGSDEEVMLAVVPKNPGLNPEIIVDFCIDNMPSFWIPNYILFMDALPKTPTGRTQKYLLREKGVTKDTVNVKNQVAHKLKNKHKA